MTKKSITDIVAAVVSELTPLQSEERQRVIQASLMLLGESSPAMPKNRGPEGGSDIEEGGEISPRAKTWMRQNNVTSDQLQQVFHTSSDGVEIIVSEIPGKIYRDKVRNAYVLLGLAQLISTGEAKFDDKDARALCERYGFFDGTNHMKHMKGGNEFTGSKDKGWILTAPGLKQGAALILELAK